MKKILLLAGIIIYVQQSVAQSGKPDPLFGANGTVTTDFFKNIHFNSKGNQVLVQPGGSLYVIFEVGGRTLVAKRLPNGSPDVSFADKGFIASCDISSGHAVLQPDGKLLLTGSLKKAIGKDPDSDGDIITSDFCVKRFNINGSIDNTFGVNGKVITNFTSFDYSDDYDAPGTINIAPDGKIVVAGYTSQITIGNSRLAIARYNSNGSPDNSFDNDGMQTLEVENSYSSWVSGIAVQGNGNIVLTAVTDEQDFVVMRYNANGHLDSSFSGDGKQYTDFNGENDAAQSLAIQKDGKIVVVGVGGGSLVAIARYTTDGSPDESFSDDGKETSWFGGTDNIARSVAIQSDGKILLTGNVINSTGADFLIARYNAIGTPDTSFSGDGKQLKDFSSRDDYAYSIAIQNDGKIVVAGTATTSRTATEFAVARFSINGSLDSSFDHDGIILGHYTAGNTIFNSTAIQGDGKIIAAGSTWNGSDFDFAVARFNNNGTPDHSFGSNGRLVENFGFTENSVSLAIQGDGKILMGGKSQNGTTVTYFLLRFNPNGRADTSFNHNGKLAVDDLVSRIRIQRDGKIIASGPKGVARYNVDGTSDAGFNGTGIITGHYEDVALQSDGKILLLDGGFGVRRLNTDGTTDAGFISHPPNFFPDYDPDNSPYDSPNAGATALSVQSDGKVVVAGFEGYYHRYNQTYSTALVRYNTNGSLDNSFSNNGIAEIGFRNYSLDPSISIQPDDRIVVKSYLYENVDNYPGQDVMVKAGFGMARINSDGSVDNSFGDNGTVYAESNDEINNIVVSKSNLYVTGQRNNAGNSGLLIRYLLGESEFSPRIKLTSPLDSADYKSPANIALTAVASDTDGTITKVEFYNGSTLLNTTSVIPYSFKWQHVPQGYYSITARATDNRGNSTTSAPAYVSVVPDSASTITFYGITFKGGSESSGTINKYTPFNNELSVAESFESFPVDPAAPIIQAANGKLYGVTSLGGGNNAGIIYSFDPLSLTYNKLKDFGGIDGGIPMDGPMLAKDGKLYGTTVSGGQYDNGVIYSFDPLSAMYTKLKDFDGSIGNSPRGSLIQATDGKLYGMMNRGGSGGHGTIYSFDITTGVFAKLMDFVGSTGGFPEGGLIQAKDGKLYGMETGGNRNNDYGTIFSFTLAKSIYKRLKNFDNANGRTPYGKLVQAKNGLLYGVTSHGGTEDFGVIFSLDPTSSAFVKLKDFHYTDGASPAGALIQGKDGKLYGTASGGSMNTSAGVVYSIDPATSLYQVIREFNSVENAPPEALYPGGLLQATDGKLYGKARGGNNDAGVIFSLDPVAKSYATLKNFGSSEKGSNPSGALVRATNGKLYGMTSTGGTSGAGVIYSYDPANATFTPLKNFDILNGANPFGSLVQASNGKLYGITLNGGLNGAGVIFSFDPFSNTFTKLKDLDVAGGAFPHGSLVQASDGKLYGMTTQGGSGAVNGSLGQGVIFSFDPATSAYVKLKSFDDLNEPGNGLYPYGSLMQASDGKLYGLTQSGGNGGYGVIFSYDPTSSTYVKLKDFNSIIGSSPYGSFIQAGTKLYATTLRGGADDFGVIFSYDISTDTYTKCYEFNGKNGAAPYGNLLHASNGKFYGITSAGGTTYGGGRGDGNGVVFSFDSTGATYTELKDFTGLNGARPYYGSVFIEVTGNVTKHPPMVKITSPADNATYLAGGNVNLTAIASDTDGSISKVEFYNGETLLFSAIDTPYNFKWAHVHIGNYTIVAKATDNSGMVSTSDTIHIVVVPNKPPLVNIINPGDGQTFVSGTTIHLQAVATDPDGRIGKVEFYIGTTLLSTEHKLPYTFDWSTAKTGNYVFTAKATDNWGAVTTSPAITISVVLNRSPVINIISPSNGQIFTAGPGGAIVNLEALAQDVDGRIVQVCFYHAGTLLTNNEHKSPYTYQWKNLPAGSYTITAVAKDNRGAETSSPPVSFLVIAAPAEPLVSNRPGSPALKTGSYSVAGIQLAPNPVRNILTISTTGLPINTQGSLSVISSSGVIIQTKRLNNLPSTIKLNVMPLTSGMYILKIRSGDQVLYKQFVKQ